MPIIVNAAAEVCNPKVKSHSNLFSHSFGHIYISSLLLQNLISFSLIL